MLAVPQDRTVWDPAIPFWLVTDQGLVVGSLDNEMGHWFIPKQALARRMERFKEAAPVPPGNSSSGSNPNPKL
jgi:hypothetical protein